MTKGPESALPHFADKRMTLSEQEEVAMLYGMYGRDKWLEMAAQSAQGNYANLYPDKLEEELIKKFGTRPVEPQMSADARNDVSESFDKRRRDRIEYQKAISNIEQHAQMLPKGTGIVPHLYGYMAGLSDDVRNDLDRKEKNTLGLHLDEIKKFSKAFFLTESGKSRFPADASGSQGLSDRHAQLLAYAVAPLHDIFKYLGLPSAQLSGEHEFITREFISKHFLNMRIPELTDGDAVLAQEDVDFIAGVIGNHENMNKPDGRTEWIRSKDPVERARALFFVADTMTGIFEQENHPLGTEFRFLDGEYGTDDHVADRFLKLYARHLDRPDRKTFDPEWGAATLKDLFATIDAVSVMNNEKGEPQVYLVLPPDWKLRFINRVTRLLEAVIDTTQKDHSSMHHVPLEKHADNGEKSQLERVKDVLRELEEMAKGL